MSSSIEPVNQSQATGGVLTHDVGELTTTREIVTVAEADREDGSLETSNFSQTLDGYLSRNIRIATGVLSGSDTVFFNLLGLLDPWFEFLNNAQILSKTAGFSRFRGDCEVTLTVTCPANAYGLYNFQALCEGGQGDPFNGVYLEQNSAASDNVWTSTQDVHALVDVTKSNSVVLRLPFVYPLDALTLPLNSGFQPNMWRILLWCLQPLRNAANSDTITATYNIYCRMMPGYELSNPVMQGEKGKGSDGGHAQSFATKVKGLRDNKTISKTAGKLAGISAAVGMAVPVLAPFAEAAAAGLATIASVADMFGFTKEAKVLEPAPMVAKAFSSVATVDGYDTSEIAALFSSNATTIDPRIGGGDGEDVAATASLYARWTIIDTFEWAGDQAEGVILRTIPVSPFYAQQVLGALYPTPAGYVGLPFRYWRGGMEYRIVVPVSVYHRGMLQVYWTPVMGAPAITTDPTHQVLNSIFDVTATTDVQLGVAYASPQMCLETQMLSQAHDATTTVHPVANGQLVFRVNSQLQAMAGDTSVTVIVLARAAVDMQFGVPRALARYLPDSSTTLPFQDTYQIQGAVGDESEAVESISLVGSTAAAGNYPTAQVLFGEEFKSVRALAQRFSWIDNVSNNFDNGSDNNSGNVIPYPHFYPTQSTAPTNWSVLLGSNNRDAPLQNIPVWTWWGHYAAMFMGVRGSARFKTLSRSEMHAVGAYAGTLGESDFFSQHLTFSGQRDGGGPASSFCAVQNTSIGSAVEYTLPYYHKEKYLRQRDVARVKNIGFPAFSSVDTQARFDYIIFGQGDPANATPWADVFYAGGPDVAFIRFRRTPTLIPGPTYT
jgi:hypothetical protein